MSLQPQVDVSLAYKVEPSFGTLPGASGAQYLRRVSSSLVPSKDSFQSNEARVDQQVADLRHGTRRVTGSIEGELSTESYDDFIEAALRGTWANGVSITETDATSVAANGSASTFTLGSSTWVALGFKEGDIIRFTNLSAAANNNVNFRITGLSGTTATVHPAPTTMGADTGFTCSVQGSKLLVGVEKRSFTIEQTNPSADNSLRFVGSRIGGMNVSLPPSGMATVGFEIQGQNGVVLEGTNSPYFSNPTAQDNTGILSGVNGALRIGSEELAIVTGLDMTVALNLSSQPVLGSTFVPEIFYGRTVITGNVSAFLKDAALIDVFLNEEETNLVAVLEAAGNSPADFLTFNMSRVKFTGISMSVAAEGGVIVSFPYQSLLKTGGAGTAYDQSSLVIQRSNAA